MGRSGAGKTSMHSIIFANYPGTQLIYINFSIIITKKSQGCERNWLYSGYQ